MADLAGLATVGIRTMTTHDQPTHQQQIDQQPADVPPLSEPIYPPRRPDVIAAAQQVLTDGDWARLEGAPELEADLAQWHQPDQQDRAPIPWFITSGTAALQAIMLGHGIGPGDEVITTPYTWAATTSAILAIGAIPVFADIHGDSGLIDASTIAPLVTPRTKALLVVHLFGQPCDCSALRHLADQHGLLLLEDGSQAHGARWQGRARWRLGRCGCV